MRKIIFYLILICMVVGVLNARSVPLPELLMPDGIEIGGSHIYITEGPRVYIYSLEDFSLVKTFGQRGEGPMEFRVNRFGPGHIYIEELRDAIMINSFRKISYYSKTGDYLREVRTVSGSRFRPVGKNFAAYGGTLFEKDRAFRTVNLYDSNFKKIKEIYREEVGKPGKEVDPVFLMKRFLYYVWDNRIFVGGGDGVIHVFDSNGKSLYKIGHEYDRVEFTEEHRRRFERDFRLHPRFGSLYEVIKKEIKYPRWFPLIKSFHISGKHLYVRTFKQENKKSEFFIFTLEGKLLKKVFLPLAEKNAFEPTPYTIKSGHLYQLIENEETENWELDITTI